MMRALQWAWLTSAVLASLLGCASAPPPKQDSALVQSAQNAERRGAQAFARGDWDAAAAGYESAALVYQTLALPEPLARARLSQARALADAGRSDLALSMVLAVVNQPNAPSADIRALAHGRAAALLMATDLPRAQGHVQEALSVCANMCSQLSALTVLQARKQLANQQNSQALASASTALQTARNDTDRANALRIRAQAHAAAGQHSAALGDAQQALALDQELGLPERVLLDLQLLQRASLAAGDAASALRYEGLAQRASAAAAVLRGDTAQPAAKP